ncbi:hypothetical protein ACFFQF_09475 [Haladaptatus pallidirubidus]|uniref:Uncharacterized protein n=1 Tax=Haladaptatus pallidirubidus TaxID=1008152 RepID=A0AAV3UFL7_9EURY|nr:hypothetical protein [Haladaptatus pallidirubidus]
MVSKRRLGASLLFLGLAFVGAFHTFLSLAFDTGLTTVGAIFAVGSLLCLVAVNVPALLD